MFTHFLVPVLDAEYLLYYTALNLFVQFVKDRVRLLECSPACSVAPRNHCEGKCEKFITRRINNKWPSLFSFDTVMRAQCRILKSRQEHIFFAVSKCLAAGKGLEWTKI